MKNLDMLTYECINELFRVGITPNVNRVTVNTRAKNRNGQCRFNGREYNINIAAFLLADDMDDFPAKNTIMHELLHTLPGCMNHGETWKRYAEKVNTQLGYRVQRCNSYNVDRNVIFKYTFVCEKCGQVIGRQRRSRFTDNYKHYRCGKCGGSFVKQ